MWAFIRTLLFAIAGLAFAIVAGLSTSPEQVSVSQAPNTPEGGISIINTATLATTTKPAGNTQSTSTKPAKVVTAPKTASTSTAPSTVLPTPPAKQHMSPEALNELVRAATVNIICITKAAGPLNSISASGVMVDPRGTIITNSHVGQYFLLKDYPSPDFVQCTIRTGSPAQPKYTAELLFLPPSWIADNASKINQSKPTGNGEHDYAFLRITGTVSPSVTMPSAFPFLSVSVNSPNDGDTILAAGYPAGFLGGITIQKELYASSAVTKIADVFTFDSDTIDLFSLGGSVVAQQGASGGAAANQDGVLMGIMVTATDASETAARDLRAITTSYIIRNFQKEAGTPIDVYLQGDTAAQARTFASTVAPALTQRLINVIEGR